MPSCTVASNRLRSILHCLRYGAGIVDGRPVVTAQLLTIVSPKVCELFSRVRKV